MDNTFQKQKDDSLHKFEDYACSAPENNDIVLSLSRLHTIMEPPSKSALAIILSELVSKGFLHQVIRIESPNSGAGLADFSSYSDVPKKIHDIYEDIYIDVRPEYIKVYYKLDKKIKDSLNC